MPVCFLSRRDVWLTYSGAEAHLLERDTKVIARGRKPGIRMWTRSLLSIFVKKKRRNIMNSKIESIRLSYPLSWNFTNNEHFKKLLQSIACLPKLSRLTVTVTPCEVNNLAFLLSHAVASKSLKELYIFVRPSGLLFGIESGFSALIISLCNLTSLEQVTIDWFKVDTSPLVRGLSSHPSLKKLSLFCPYFIPHATIETSALGRVAHLSSLLELQVTDHKLQKEHLTTLANELRDLSSSRTCSLKVLRFHVSAIVDNDIATAFSDLLRVNQSLECLEINELFSDRDSSAASQVCLRSLVASLQSNITLKTLEVLLRDNRLVNIETMFSFQDLLCHSNYTLENVSLSVSRHYPRPFDYYCNLNRYVRSSLKNADNLSRADWVDALGRCTYHGRRGRKHCDKEIRDEQEKESLSFLFSILSENPWLCQTGE